MTLYDVLKQYGVLGQTGVDLYAKSNGSEEVGCHAPYFVSDVMLKIPTSQVKVSSVVRELTRAYISWENDNVPAEYRADLGKDISKRPDMSIGERTCEMIFSAIHNGKGTATIEYFATDDGTIWPLVRIWGGDQIE